MKRAVTFLLITVFSLTVGILLPACSGDGQRTNLELETELETLKASKKDMESRIAALQDTLKARGVIEEHVKLAAVSTETLHKDTLQHFIQIQGVVESDLNVMVSPKQTGIVTRIHVKEGDYVEAGTVLAEMDATLLTKQLAEVETQLELAEILYDKRKRVWESKVGSEVEYLQARAERDALKRRVASLNEQIDMMKIRAPFGGTIDKVIVKAGEAANPGLGAFHLVSNSGLKAAVEIAESYRTSIKKGDPIWITFPDAPEDTVVTRISAISEAIDVTNRTFTVYAKLPAAVRNAKPNMICTATLNDVSAHDVIVAPVNTIMRFNNEQFVYVLEQNSNGYTARKRMVQTGISYRDKIVVRKGLNAGDRLITIGFQDVSDGDQVQPL